MVFHGSISTITPSLKLDKMPITMIRPLCLLQESELKRFAELRGYVKQQKLCPYEHDSHRADAKRLVSQLEQLNPNVRESIWHALHTVREQYLPKFWFLCIYASFFVNTLSVRCEWEFNSV